MVPKVSQFREELADREAIRDCLFRYCRGIDRMDPEILASAYWPGALDHHTGFEGTVEQFIEWALPRLAAMEQGMHIDGATAKVESYLWSVSVLPGDAPRRVVTCGRYNDRFEKRDDEWRIAERWVVHDWYEEAANTGDWNAGPFGMSGLLRGAVKPHDQSYGWLGLE
jgi:hypothetical protein